MTNSTVTKLEAQQWAGAFAELNNSDEEIRAHGKYFTCSYLPDMGEHTFVIKVYDGQITEIAVDPGPIEASYQFAIRASVETWRGFGQPIPAPMFHGIWAASFQRDMRLDGDVLTLMQNLRCVTRQIELLRQTGVPV